MVSASWRMIIRLQVFQTRSPLLRIEKVWTSEGYEYKTGFEALKHPR
jgi:hypothetical protein